MVHEQRPLTVRRGRGAYIHPLDILLTVPEGAMCRIEVDEYDPMSQRVGHLQPKVRYIPTYTCIYLYIPV